MSGKLPVAPIPEGYTLPRGSEFVSAMVDTMATYFVIPDRRLLHRVTDSSPRMGVETADGVVNVEAIGDLVVGFPIGPAGAWRYYLVHNVLVLPNCTACLYATRVMKSAFGFHHHIDDDYISIPPSTHSSQASSAASRLEITDDGSAYAIPMCIRTDGQLPPYIARSKSRPLSLLCTGTAMPANVSGTPQAVLYQRLGFPYAQQWRYVSTTTSDHGLPPGTVVSTTLPVHDAVMRGRARALPFLRKDPADRTIPPPGAVAYMDFCGPMVPSYPHGYIAYCGCVDAGSGYARALPSHSMRKEVASATLAIYVADLRAKMGLTDTFQPCVVNSDNGSAFVSQLVYKPNSELGFHVLVDSSWGTKFSCSGAFFFYMGCHFHWFAKMQKSVTLSSAEAEYFGAMLAAKDTIFIRDILVDLGLLKPGPTVIYADSKSAVDMAFDPVAFKNTKHILRAAEFLRDLVAREVVTLEHLRGEIMVADLLTKSVARPTFLKLVAMLESYSTLPSSVAPP